MLCVPASVTTATMWRPCPGFRPRMTRQSTTGSVPRDARRRALAGIECGEYMRERLLLRLSQGSYESAIVGRNATNRVLAMDLDGFFSHVFLVFFKADADRVVRLSPRHTVFDVAV